MLHSIVQHEAVVGSDESRTGPARNDEHSSDRGFKERSRNRCTEQPTHDQSRYGAERDFSKVRLFALDECAEFFAAGNCRRFEMSLCLIHGLLCIQFR
jgi:hypothetical protein